MKRQDSEIRQESQSEDSKVIERLSEIAKQYEMEFSDDVSENMETLEVLIDALREDMKLTLVNEVAKLKTEYLQAVGQTAGRTQE